MKSFCTWSVYAVLSLASLTLNAGATERESGGRLASSAIAFTFAEVGNGIDRSSVLGVLEYIAAGLKTGDVAEFKMTTLADGSITICVRYDNSEYFRKAANPELREWLKMGTHLQPISASSVFDCQ